MAMQRAFTTMRAETPDWGQILPPRRSPLEELRDYPFFAPESDTPEPSWLARHGLALLLVLLVILAFELGVLLFVS